MGQMGGPRMGPRGAQGFQQIPPSGPMMRQQQQHPQMGQMGPTDQQRMRFGPGGPMPPNFGQMKGQQPPGGPNGPPGMWHGNNAGPPGPNPMSANVQMSRVSPNNPIAQGQAMPTGSPLGQMQGSPMNPGKSQFGFIQALELQRLISVPGDQSHGSPMMPQNIRSQAPGMPNAMSQRSNNGQPQGQGPPPGGGGPMASQVRMGHPPVSNKLKFKVRLT